MKIVLILIAAMLGHSILSCQSTGILKTSSTYFPVPDNQGGWRTITDAEKMEKLTGINNDSLGKAFDFVRTTTKNGGLLVVRHGWLVYENYFGLGQRDATPNLASCGKSFTSIAVGILMDEHPELFHEGLEQKIFTPAYLPAHAFPLPDHRMAGIKLGQLLSFSAGIRGNNPVYINGKPSSIDPFGPDGWYGMTDDYSLGIRDGSINGNRFTTKSLWCEPGAGYSYATASIHIASIMLRHVSGIELEDYIRSHIATPLGWGTWGFGYKNQKSVSHTPGGGGIALRSTDMLRFCYLLLNQGRWGNQQIVPAAYIQKATCTSPYNPHYPYSLQFNVNRDNQIKELPADAYWKSGSGGHCLYVVPSLDLIVWKLGGRDSQYSSGDTGIPQPARKDQLKSLPATGVENPDVTTLKMIINSITKVKN